MNIKTWQERLLPHDGYVATVKVAQITLMQAEIDELRAALKAQPVQEPAELAEITAYIVKIARWAGGKIEVERQRGAGYFHAEVDALVALRPYTLYWLKAQGLGGGVPMKAPKIPDTLVQPVQPAPLTRNQIDDAVNAAGYEEPQERADFINGMRHCELAHGILGAAVRTGGAG